ncbi:MAG: HNH/ENDO VII family nuclease, partial [Lachnospiraceae bacterium]|nr:HNH/ENDO VII family nuclease [Lachnospiraceae bacterium]
LGRYGNVAQGVVELVDVGAHASAIVFASWDVGTYTNKMLEKYLVNGEKFTWGTVGEVAILALGGTQLGATAHYTSKIPDTLDEATEIIQKSVKVEIADTDPYVVDEALKGYELSVGEGGTNPSTKPYTNSRPSFRKGVVEEVWENAKGPDGLVRDPNTGEVINWTPGESRKGVWDMGHIPEAKYSDVHDLYMNGELTTKEFVDWYNDPDNYRPELPSNNRSHKYE